MTWWSVVVFPSRSSPINQLGWSLSQRIEAADDRGCSCQDLPCHFASDVRQPIVAAGVPVGEPLMVEAEQVEDRRLKVVYMHSMLDGGAAIVIRLPIDHTCQQVGAGLLELAAARPQEHEPKTVVFDKAMDLVEERGATAGSHRPRPSRPAEASATRWRWQRAPDRAGTTDRALRPRDRFVGPWAGPPTPTCFFPPRASRRERSSGPSGPGECVHQADLLRVATVPAKYSGMNSIRCSGRRPEGPPERTQPSPQPG